MNILSIWIQHQVRVHNYTELLFTERVFTFCLDFFFISEKNNFNSTGKLFIEND